MYFILFFYNFAIINSILTMNNQILQLEKQSAALLSTISQLLNEDKLTTIDKDYLKHQCLLLYELILELTPVDDEEIKTPVVEETVHIIRETAPIVQEPIPAVPENIPVVPETIPVPEAEEPLKVAMQQKPLFEQELTLNDL